MNVNEAIPIELVLAVGLLSAGVLAAGLVVGYWRGVRRGHERAILTGAANPDLARLAGIGRAILSAQLRLDALCEIVYQQASRIVDTRNFQLGVFDGDDYAIKVWLRDGERLTGQQFCDAGKIGLIGWVRSSAQPLLVADYQRDWDKLPAKPAYDAAHPPRSSVFAPLIAGGDVIGVIAVHSDIANAFTEETQRLLMVISSQAAGAIRNAQLYEQAHDRAEQLRVIGEVSRQITAVQPMPDLFRQIVTLVHDTFNYYAVSIFR